MIRHVVIWALNHPEDAPKFKTLLDSCADVVPGIVSFEVGIRTPGLEANADVVLLSTFADAAALEAYQRHPQHKAVSAQLGPMRQQRSVVDFLV